MKSKDAGGNTLNGAAQDNVELALARGIRRIEAEMGQSVNTLNIRDFVAAANERHNFVPETRVDDLAVNVEQAYGYVTSRTPLPISHVAYLSYKADGFKDKVVDTVVGTLQELGSALGVKTPRTS